MDFRHLSRARLSEFLDGALSASEREKVDAHLQTCAACSQMGAELEAERELSSAALGELAPLRAPANLRFKVRAALETPAPTRVRPVFIFDWRRLSGAKYVWTGTLTVSALALMILARPIPPTLVSPAPQKVSETQASRARPTDRVVAPRRAAPAQTSLAPAPRAKNAPPKSPKISVARPLPAPTATTSRRAEALRRANSPNPAPLSPPAIAIPAQPRAQSLKASPAKDFTSPAFPALSNPSSPSATAPSNAPRVVARRDASPPAPALPRIVAAPDVGLKQRAAAGAASQNVVTSGEVEDAPRFAVALSAIAASPSQNETSVLGRQRTSVAQGLLYDNDLPREKAASTAKSVAPAASPSASAPRRAEEPRTKREESFAGDLATGRANALESRAPASSLADEAVPSISPLSSPPAPRSFRLMVTTPRAVAGAQIRVVLPPQLRFSATDASASRTLWRGDFAANVPINLDFSLLGARGDAKISLVVEQNEGEGKSKTLQTQTLTLPPAN